MKNGTANFGRNIPTETSGPLLEVLPNIPVGGNRNWDHSILIPVEIFGIFGIGRYSKHPHIRTHDFGGQADRVLI